MKLSPKKGSIVKVEFENREIEAIVIDPNGLGQGQPSVGLGFNMAEKYMGIKQNTLSNWAAKESGFEGDRNGCEKSLKLPSGNTLTFIQILGTNNHTYSVIEASDWVNLAKDVLKHPGKVRKPTKDKLIDFLCWFAVKGFYADAYTAIKGQYTAKDSRAVAQWFQSRIAGIPRRKKYTDFLQSNGCRDVEFAKWTNYVYLGLFGMTKAKMVAVWNHVDGSKHIGRNYVPESVGLEAIAYCEQLVVDLFHRDLQQAHDDAISFTQKRFFNGELAVFAMASV